MKTGLFPPLRTSIPAVKKLEAVTVAVFLSVFLIPAVAGIRINESPSLPLGLYLINDKSGQLVEFCPAEPFASLAIQRAYRGPGNCPDGGAPLMKPEVARAGDIVEIDFRGVAVNGKLLPNSAPLPFDTQGWPLEHSRFGLFKVNLGDVWAISSYNPRSFDSRYLGPITSSQIQHHLIPMVTW